MAHGCTWDSSNSHLNPCALWRLQVVRVHKSVIAETTHISAASVARARFRIVAHVDTRWLRRGGEVLYAEATACRGAPIRVAVLPNEETTGNGTRGTQKHHQTAHIRDVTANIEDEWVPRGVRGIVETASLQSAR
jgi:hypothetical protein